MPNKILTTLLIALILCSCLFSCTEPTVSDNSETQADTTTVTETETDLPETTDPIQVAIDVATEGGAVIVGEIGYDENGWFITPEQPLNVTYHYFLDNPSVFPYQTRISMFDPKDDGFEKALYLGQQVTATGSFRFYRDDFETLYFMPYTITIGKNAAGSYGDSSIVLISEPVDRYDRSWPLPKYMDPMVVDGEYVYNAFMLSEESIMYMGNDFTVFYVGFVDAFLNYQSEFECPDKEYALMLSTIIYYEFPLYNACAEPFEYFKHYDPEKGTVSIAYKYDKETHSELVSEFMDAANDILADADPEQSDYQKAKSVYHSLCTRMTYDYSALTDIERKESYYAYLNNSGVCITFANVYNQLLTQMGIKTSLAHCDVTDTLGHSWSIITIDDKQYFCDPTYELNYDNGNGYRFFGMSYADRIADGIGADGIRYGRYYFQILTSDMISDTSLEG